MAEKIIKYIYYREMNTIIIIGASIYYYDFNNFITDTSCVQTQQSRKMNTA
jgi:hypothetical protein